MICNYIVYTYTLMFIVMKKKVYKGKFINENSLKIKDIGQDLEMAFKSMLKINGFFPNLKYKKNSL